MLIKRGSRELSLAEEPSPVVRPITRDIIVANLATKSAPTLVEETSADATASEAVVSVSPAADEPTIEVRPPCIKYPDGCKCKILYYYNPQF